MPQDLLDFPPEVFQRVIHELVLDVGVVKAWPLRSVCRTFAAEIHDDIFARQPKEAIMASMDTPNHQQIIRRNLTVYLRNQLNSRLDAKGVLVSRLKKLWDYITQELNILEFEQRQEYATRLIDGIVDCMEVPDMMAYIWDENHVSTRYRSFYHLNVATHYRGTSTTASEQLLSAIAVGAHDLVPSLFDLARRATSSMTLPILREPLPTAITQDDVQMVQILLSCYRNLRDITGRNIFPKMYSAVRLAIKSSKLEILKLMLDVFKISKLRVYDRRPLLEEAIGVGSMPTLDTLLKAQGGQKGIVTKRFVEYMCRYSSFAMFNHCIAIGLLDVNKTYQRTSPLIMVTEGALRWKVDRIATLIAAGANINKAAGDGATVLFIASRSNHKYKMNYLLDQGADTNTDNWPTSRYDCDAAKRNLQAVLASRSAARLGAPKSRKSKSKSKSRKG